MLRCPGTWLGQMCAFFNSAFNTALRAKLTTESHTIIGAGCAAVNMNVVQEGCRHHHLGAPHGKQQLLAVSGVAQCQVGQAHIRQRKRNNQVVPVHPKSGWQVRAQYMPKRKQETHANQPGLDQKNSLWSLS